MCLIDGGGGGGGGGLMIYYHFHFHFVFTAKLLMEYMTIEEKCNSIDLDVYFMDSTHRRAIGQ